MFSKGKAQPATSIFRQWLAPPDASLVQFYEVYLASGQLSDRRCGVVALLETATKQNGDLKMSVVGLGNSLADLGTWPEIWSML